MTGNADPRRRPAGRRTRGRTDVRTVAVVAPVVLAAVVLMTGAALTLLAGDRDPSPPRDDPEAVAMLAKVRQRLLGRPLFASARLVVRRGALERSLWLRLHVRDEKTTLARIQGPPREDGTKVLRADGHILVYLPRADLVMELPPSLGSDRLFGSDFAIDDLLAPGGDPARFVATLGPEETAGGAPCLRIDLFPRTPRDALTAKTSVWLERETLVPRRVEVFGDRGTRLRVVETEGPAENGLPLLWRARTDGRRGASSELRFVFVEPDPPVEPEFFTREGLRKWR